MRTRFAIKDWQAVGHATQLLGSGKTDRRQWFGAEIVATERVTRVQTRQGFWAVIRTRPAVRSDRARQRLAVVIVTAELPDTVWPALHVTKKPRWRLDRLCVGNGKQCDSHDDRQFRSIHDGLKINSSVT